MRLCRCTPRLVGIFFRAGTSALGAARGQQEWAQATEAAKRGGMSVEGVLCSAVPLFLLAASTCEQRNTPL